MRLKKDVNGGENVSGGGAGVGVGSGLFPKSSKIYLFGRRSVLEGGVGAAGM